MCIVYTRLVYYAFYVLKCNNEVRILNSKWIKRLGVLLLLLLLVFQTAACQKTAEQGDTEEDGTASSYIFTMGTVFDIRVFAEDASEIMQEAEQALYGCDSLLPGERRVISIQI